MEHHAADPAGQTQHSRSLATESSSLSQEIQQALARVKAMHPLAMLASHQRLIYELADLLVRLEVARIDAERQVTGRREQEDQSREDHSQYRDQQATAMETMGMGRREDCYQCDGDGFSGDPLGGNCPRCGGSGKERS